MATLIVIRWKLDRLIELFQLSCRCHRHRATIASNGTNEIFLAFSIYIVQRIVSVQRKLLIFISFIFFFFYVYSLVVYLRSRQMMISSMFSFCLSVIQNRHCSRDQTWKRLVTSQNNSIHERKRIQYRRE